MLGLTWDCIDFESCTITIKQQLQKVRGSGGDYVLVSTKNGKTRIISPASYVMQVLTGQRKAQNMQRLRAGSLWSNPHNLVFTNSLGKNLCAQTVYLRFKKLAADAGFLPPVFTISDTATQSLRSVPVTILKQYRRI